MRPASGRIIPAGGGFMSRPSRSALVILALLALPALASPGAAQGPNKDREKRGKKEEKEHRKIGERARKMLRDYFHAHHYEVRPLPPGLAREIVIGRPLPPGIRKRYLPRPVLVEVPVYRGYTRYIVGGNVVLVDRSGVVVDIAVDIFK